MWPTGLEKNRVFRHLAIAGEGGAGKKPAGVGGGGNESPENDITNEEGDHENCDNSNEEGDHESCDYFFSKSKKNFTCTGTSCSAG